MTTATGNHKISQTLSRHCGNGRVSDMAYFTATATTLKPITTFFRIHHCQSIGDIPSFFYVNFKYRGLPTHWIRGDFEGNTVRPTIVEKLPERIGTPFPLLTCLRTHYGRHCEPFSLRKCTSILHIQSQNFSGDNTPDPHRSAPGTWSQTPISARLASVSNVPTKRPMHWTS